MVEEVALRLQNDFDITIVTARLRRDLPRHAHFGQTVKIHRVGFGFAFDKWLFPFLGAFVAIRKKPDLIHAVLETFAGLALFVTQVFSPKTKRLLTLQTTNKTMFLKTIHRSAHAITAISSFLILRARNFGRNDVVYIPNGIPLADIRHALTRYERTHGRILYVGRLEPMKGVDTLLEAFAMLSDLPLTLMIVGEGEEREKLEALAKELRVSDRVSFEGYTAAPKLFDLYAQSEIFCGLSRSEALGNVFLEAQAAQCAVVATNVGGIPEIVKDQITGLLVRPDDPRAAAEAIRRLLEDTVLRQRLIEQSQIDIERFDWDNVADRYKHVYTQLTAAAGRVA